MSVKPVPSHPSLEQYRKQAKDLVKAHRAADPAVLKRIRAAHPHFAELPDPQIASSPFQLTDAQFLLAREHGFVSWPKFKSHIDSVNFRRKALLANDPSAVFLEAACIPMGESHSSGTLEAADALLAENPELARSNIYTAAVLGDHDGVMRFLAATPEAAAIKGGPHEWDALTYLCFSRYLRLDHARSDGFVLAAAALLDAGASANTGWYEGNDESRPFWESVIYGAAGLAQNVELSRLLLDRGADPNDDETPYHVPESYNNAVMQVLVESGKLNADSLTTLLVRKADWHDFNGLKYLLEQGADPNWMTRWGHSPLHQALRRDNSARNIDLLLDHGADLRLVNAQNGRSGMAMAARRGRGDVLASAMHRGTPLLLEEADQLIAACAQPDEAAIRIFAANQPRLVQQLLADGGTLLAEFAGNGNTEGVRHLLDLGVSVSALYREGDGYFEVAKESTALHVAVWRAQHETVQFLITRGAQVNVQDARGRTPLALAIRACIDSHWTERRSPASIEALLRAGASLSGIDIPTGYPEADALLLAHREKR